MNDCKKISQIEFIILLYILYDIYINTVYIDTMYL